MQPALPLLLVSCTACQQLHVPRASDVSNPLCGRCTPLAHRPIRFDDRPLER